MIHFTKCVMLSLSACIFLISGCVLWEEAPPYQPTLTNNTATSGMMTTTNIRLCRENQRVLDNECVACSLGQTNEPGDVALGPDTTCDEIKCEENFRVQFNRCVACAKGEVRAAGDLASGPDTQCEAVLCDEAQKVVGNACVPCELGTSRPRGDDASGTDTSCEPVLCEENFRVSENVCVACEEGTINDAGDDASGGDTQCVTRYTSIMAAGYNKMCAKSAQGDMKCWGVVGIERRRVSGAPVPVEGLPKDVKQIVSGLNHSCVLTGSNTVKCWGGNSKGQLGQDPGLILASDNPLDVTGLENVLKITAGRNHTCALNNTGQIKCWGEKGSRLGRRMQNDFYVPTSVGGPQLIYKDVQTGPTSSHTCAIADKDIYCWGDNSNGQLGLPKSSFDVPTKISALGSAISVKQLAFGQWHTCVLQFKDLFCLGKNRSGQLGDSTSKDATMLQSIDGLADGVTDVSAGGLHTCAVTSLGNVWCWGSNLYQQLGELEVGSSPTPARVEGLKNAVKVVSGYGYNCALTQRGEIYCWGRSNLGQLGDGDNLPGSLVPEINPNLEPTRIKSMDTSAEHTCIVTDAGGVKCWGENFANQLGNGLSTASHVPVDVLGVQNAVKVCTSDASTCALLKDGQVSCWGEEIGALPTLVDGFSEAADLDCSYFNQCIVTANGGVKCRGTNDLGQLGVGDINSRLSVVDVVGLPDPVVSVEIDLLGSCALSAKGDVWCWGSNANQVVSSAPDQLAVTPVKKSGLSSKVIQMSRTSASACALLDTGNVECWGDNGEGQLGDGSKINRAIPVLVKGILQPVSRVGVGYGSACATLVSGEIKCWGRGSQLSNGIFIESVSPVTVSDAYSSVTNLSVREGGCVIIQDQRLLCWGQSKNHFVRPFSGKVVLVK